jgi:diguanylate cyclase (GGDEF)-like protein
VASDLKQQIIEQTYPKLAEPVSQVRRLRLMLVSRQGADIHRLEKLIDAAGPSRFHVDWVHGLAEAAEAAKDARDTRYDAVILHLARSDDHNPKAIRALNELLSDIPLVICGDSDDEDAAVKTLAFGAQDYVVMDSTDANALIRSIRFAIERNRMERKLRTLVHYDSLTHLPNRQLLLDRLTQAIAQATRQETLVGLLLLDLDRFKLVNDTLGHEFGDKLLTEVAQRVNGCIRDSDTLARLGGDEFVVVLNGINGAQDAAKVAKKIIERLSKPIVIEGHEVFVTTSIGISLFPNDGMDKNALITNADVAMYRAKDEGRNHFQFYTYGMNATTVEKLTLENDLRRAIERDELLLHYQPQIRLPDRKIVGVEALVRWQHPELGLIPPARFIPIAEETGLIVPIGQWVLEQACAQAKEWLDSGLPPLVVSVNMSSRQFHQEDMLATVTNALEESGLSANQLALEITESSLMLKPDDAVITLCLLHNMGVGIAIDDFGTGYSSLGHLKRFPLQSLKIDRSFVNDVTENSEDAAIVRAILAMAHSLKLKVCAEGVELEKQLEFLDDAGCDKIQGFLISKPVPAKQIAEEFLNSVTEPA